MVFGSNNQMEFHVFEQKIIIPWMSLSQHVINKLTMDTSETEIKPRPNIFGLFRKHCILRDGNLI